VHATEDVVDQNSVIFGESWRSFSFWVF